jgi:site-specific DNA recombinase
MAGTPRRVGGRTLIDLDPDQLIWVLLVCESTDRERQLDNQLTDLRAEVGRIGGRIDQEIPENAVSAFKRQRVTLPDGTYGLLRRYKDVQAAADFLDQYKHLSLRIRQ